MSDVIQRPDGWGFLCPHAYGCAPFSSTGWPTQESAQARLGEHLAEHETGAEMTPLHEFRALHGLTVNDDGSVSA